MSNKSKSSADEISNKNKKPKSSDENENSQKSSGSKSSKNKNSNGKGSRNEPLGEISNTLESSKSISNSFDRIPNRQVITDSQLATFSDSPTDNYESIASDLIEKAIEGIFERKKITIGDQEKSYSPVWNFVDCLTEYAAMPKGFIYPPCILCNSKVKMQLGKNSNLFRHLKTNNPKHEKFKTWFTHYKASTASDLGIYLIYYYFVIFK